MAYALVRAKGHHPFQYDRTLMAHTVLELLAAAGIDPEATSSVGLQVADGEPVWFRTRWQEMSRGELTHRLLRSMSEDEVVKMLVTHFRKQRPKRP